MYTDKLRPEAFFDLSQFARDLFCEAEFAWDVLGQLEQLIDRLIGSSRTILGEISPEAYLADGPLYIGEGAVIEPGAYVIGPAYIGAGVRIRHGAYVRENVLMLEGSLLGHASEAKHSLLLEKAQAPHFNYVGDSVLGSSVNLGAGTKLSNLTLTSAKDPVTGQRPTISISVDGQEYETGLAKLGAILGDGVQTGCNAVLSPGCLIGPNSFVYPNLALQKGYFPADRIIKLRQTISTVERRR